MIATALAMPPLATAATAGFTGLSGETLATVWFGLLGVLLIGYAILDGFDFGVGMMHPFVARTDSERRVVLNSIGPLWDGNEVWLVTFGGALFAAFPEAYATIFSAFYDALFLVLLGLVLRAVSIEFRSKLETPRWRRIWDLVFFASSVLVSFLFGVAVGNAMQGIPLDERHNYTGTLGDQLGPFPLAAGVLSVALFALHGAAYLYLKTEGAVLRRVQTCLRIAYAVFVVAFAGVTWTAFQTTPEASANLQAQPLLWAIPLLNALSIGAMGLSILRRRHRQVFPLSCLSVAAFVALLGISLFPYMVRSSVAPADHSLTVTAASSSVRTLEIMLVIAAIGMPLVLTYTGIVYWTFRGRTRLGRDSY